MDKDELLRLAERVEALDGPSREVDREIAGALGHEVQLVWIGPDYRNSQWVVIDRSGVAPATRSIPSFTASLDAALTLVPEGWETAIYLGGERTNVQMETEAMRNAWQFTPIDATAATPALALCAAALRARAEQVQS